MSKNLVIVESPAKAKTIARFLGKDFSVKSSFGHIRDLPKKNLSVDIKHNFKPTYVIPPDKQKVVNDLKKAAKNSTVWLASDEDREGEAIAWHITVALDLKPSDTKRIVFHEITEPAITRAVKSPRPIDMKLVDAQQARRILDRLVGYELSPILWKKVRPGLSAGRVQSVAVRLVVERENEIKKFKASFKFKITGQFKAAGKPFPAELKDRLETKDKVIGFLEAAKKADFTIGEVTQKPGTRSPSAPFTTSTMQQEAARRLGFSVKQTMTIAQRLYEEGHITYMRTDSTNISQIAISQAKDYIVKNYGERYSRPQQYATKTRGAQEAHEAIRVTHIHKTSAGRDSGQKKLYELIWRRTVASQMTPAQIQRSEVEITLSNRKEIFIAYGEILNFDGFLKVYGGTKEDVILPPLSTGQKVEMGSILALQTYDRPPARYSEASLVKKLEELGIGRPSTYAPTISTIQNRGYIQKGDVEGELRQVLEIKLEKKQIHETQIENRFGADRTKLLPTELADVVTDFLTDNFADIVDYDFTAKAEEELDDIADGKQTPEKMLHNFYRHFHTQVKSGEKVSRSEALQVRKLGTDPKTKKPIFVRYGRYGPVLQLGDSPDPKDKQAPKPHFAPLPEGSNIDEVNLDQALPMFKLPRNLGTSDDGQEILVSVGPYGPYVKVGQEYISIKDEDPLSITKKEAQALITQKKKDDSKKMIADFGEIKILNGPYGPYVTNGKQNARIPKTEDPKKIDLKSAQKLLALRDKQKNVVK